jgi:S1-C subfamily serine protease
MLRPDANDQAKVPNQFLPRTPWPSTGEERSNQPTTEGNWYQPELPSSPSLGGETHVAYQQCPPMWNTGGRLAIAPTVKASARELRTASILALTVVMAIIFGIGLFAGWDFARNTSSASTNAVYPLQSNTNLQQAVPSNNIETVREAAIAKVRPAVVQVNVSMMTDGGEQGIQSGSGVIVNKRGYIITNNHVVQGAQSIEVVFADGEKIENVQLAGSDPNDDLAVLKVTPTANMIVATLGDSSKLQVGQEVLAIGNPLGITETATHGIISALGRSVSESHHVTIPNTIQTDAPINPGNSGGALADLQGNVIGIPTLAAIDPEFDAPANGVGFAIPINQVKLVVPQIIQNGSVTHTGRAALDIEGQNVDVDLQAMDSLSVDHGVLVVEVQSNGAAAQVGVQQGDVIVAIDGKEVDNQASLGDVLVTKAPGDKVSISVYRGSQQLTFNVTLGELPAS